jgi:hypothetical protein
MSKTLEALRQEVSLYVAHAEERVATSDMMRLLHILIAHFEEREGAGLGIVIDKYSTELACKWSAAQVIEWFEGPSLGTYRDLAARLERGPGK